MVETDVESFIVIEGVFDSLFDRFEYALLSRKVDNTYVDYCIDQIVDMAVTPICIDRVIWDHHPEKYDYTEECEEPQAGRGDFHMIEQKTIDPRTLAPESHMNMEEFSQRYMSCRDNWGTKKSTPVK
jgi:hypothetical protein